MSGCIFITEDIIWSTKGWLFDNMFEDVKRLWPPGHEDLLQLVIDKQEANSWILLCDFNDNEYRMFHQVIRGARANETRNDPEGVTVDDWDEILKLLDANPRKKAGT
jgi:hypothetical protein